jgi:hypothetical protein
MRGVNATQIPNFVFDEILNKVSGNAFKLLLIIIRKTRGFSDNEKAISLTQFCALTTTSRQTVVTALAELEANNLIEVLRNPRGDHNGSKYRLCPALFGEFISNDDDKGEGDQTAVFNCWRVVFGCWRLF